MKRIMFNDAFGLTQAVKKGHKTNTRRQEKALDREIRRYEEAYKVPFYFSSQYYDHGWECLVLRTSNGIIKVKPRYKVGEVVAVAQPYCEIMPYLADSFYKPAGGFMEEKPGYRNKMFVKADLMPHRIRITDVRVERLQDISKQDCLREGIEQLTFDIYTFEGWKFFCHDPREAFADLIDKISGKGTWESNPWVPVYEFELVK